MDCTPSTAATIPHAWSCTTTPFVAYSGPAHHSGTTVRFCPVCAIGGHSLLGGKSEDGLLWVRSSRVWVRGTESSLIDAGVAQYSKIAIMRRRALLGVLALLGLLATSVSAHSLPLGEQAQGRTLLGASDHKYNQDEHVPLWASKVGPFTNPR